MLHEFSRTELLIGKGGLDKLKKARVAIFGIGGVGTFVVEGLARAGVGRFVLIDDDLVCVTNINRQIHATHETIGRPKVEVMKERVLSINPKAEVETYQRFYMPGSAGELIRQDYDYIVDAIDTVTAKIDIVVQAGAAGIPVISSMGTGNKLEPTRLEVADIYKTSMCPLAKVMRKELKNRGVRSLKVVYSREDPLKPLDPPDSDLSAGGACAGGPERTGSPRRSVPGSISFMPSVAGLIIASEVVRDLLGGCWPEPGNR